MNILKDEVIIYDDECPMCNIYTGAFTQFGVLDSNGRITYASMDKMATCHFVDKDRARNEIALVNTRTGRVRYGLDSLMYILSTKLPVFKPLFDNRLFYGVMKQLYMLISYNRKVIAPSSRESATSCIPDFNVKYRFIYIMIALYLAGFLAWKTGSLLPASHSPFEVLLITGAFWMLHSLSAIVLIKEKSIVYLGHLVTTLLIGGLLMLPSLTWQGLATAVPTYVVQANALLSVMVMGWQYTRRIRLMHLPAQWSLCSLLLCVMLIILV